MTSQPQLPPRTTLTCPADPAHKIRTRQPPGSVLQCTACGQLGRHGVNVTVPAPLPSIRPPVPATPEGMAVIQRRKTGPERYVCAGCHGSAAVPAAGEPVPGWLVLLADRELLARACSAECLARVLPQVREKLSERPWTPPEPGTTERISLASLMRERPAGRR